MKKIMAILLMAVTCFLHSNGQITGGEYFFDTDPGIGSGNKVSVAAGDSITDNFSVPTVGLGVGFHRFYLRYSYSDSSWGIPEPVLFYVYDTTPPVLQPVSPNISNGEYFFDTDPGIGLGTALPAITASDSISQTYTFSTAGLGVGFHRVYTRYHDPNGNWGIAEDRLFFVYDTTPPVLTVQPDIVAGEYFIDNEPGIGNGTPITVSPATDSLAQSLNIPVGSLSLGTHYLYLRYKDADGKWGIAEPVKFNVCTPPPATITAAGDTTFCSPGSVTLNADTGKKYSYQWELNNVVLTTTASDTTNEIVVSDTSGLYSIVITDSSGCSGVSSPVTVTIGYPYDTTLNVAICQGTSYNFDNKTLTTSGLYFDSLKSAAGCDSVITLNLLVSSFIITAFNVTICADSSYSFGGKSYDVTGSYSDTLQAVGGCDSVSTLNLTVDTPSVTFTGLPDTICKPGAAITLSGGSPLGGTYSGNSVYAGLFYPDSATAGIDTIAYSYTDGNGCSNTALDIADISVCTGIETITTADFSIFPNPTEGLLNIKGPGTNADMYIELHDMLGRKLIEQKVSGSNAISETLDLSNLPGGFYFLNIRNGTGDIMLSRLIAKDR